MGAWRGHTFKIYVMNEIDGCVIGQMLVIDGSEHHSLCRQSRYVHTNSNITVLIHSRLYPCFMGC